jgi:hypothetical protein
MTMTTFQRDDDQDIELETTKKLDAQHDEFIDADADADAARAQQDDKDAGMWSEWQNLGILETFKTFRFTCLLCMMAAFSAATDGYQVRVLSLSSLPIFFFLFRAVCLFVLTFGFIFPPFPFYSLYTPSLLPQSLSFLSLSLHQHNTGLAHQIGINGNIVANRGFVQQFGTIRTEDGAVALAAPILSGWNSCINVGQIIAMLAFPP